MQTRLNWNARRTSGVIRADLNEGAANAFQPAEHMRASHGRKNHRLEAQTPRSKARRNGSRLRVSDTGIGMTRAVGKALEAFSQPDASMTRKYGGTGWGWPSAGRFAQMMGAICPCEANSAKGRRSHVKISDRRRETSDTKFTQKPSAEASRGQRSW